MLELFGNVRVKLHCFLITEQLMSHAGQLTHYVSQSNWCTIHVNWSITYHRVIGVLCMSTEALRITEQLVYYTSQLTHYVSQSNWCTIQANWRITYPRTIDVLFWLTDDVRIPEKLTYYSVLLTLYRLKVKSSKAKSLPVKNLLPQNVGSIINYLQ